jgi:hypothetical protein
MREISRTLSWRGEIERWLEARPATSLVYDNGSANFIPDYGTGGSESESGVKYGIGVGTV